MSNIVLADGAPSAAHDPAEMRVVWGVGILLVLSTAASTVIHHLFPTVLDVPIDEMRRLGVPYMDYPSMFVMDMVPLTLAWLCFYHAWKRLGPYRAMIFLGGSFVFTGVEESMWILLGRYSLDIQQALGGPQAATAVLGDGARNATGTYYFTRGFFWFLETPISACVGWFFVAYSTVYIADVIMPKAKIATKAAVGGLIAVNLDLWLDPIQTSKTFISWVWAGSDAINVFSIPLSNFVGWFLLIFLFALVFEKLPDMIKKWGPLKTAINFYAILMGLEICVLLFFGFYGAIAMRIFPQPINVTVWGI